MTVKYFIDTHDKTKGSFPKKELTEQQFFDNFDALDKAADQFGAFGHATHVNLKEGKAFCFMSGPDEESIRKAHAAINFPYDSITEVRRVTGADMRIPQPAQAAEAQSGLGSVPKDPAQHAGAEKTGASLVWRSREITNVPQRCSAEMNGVEQW
jgi:hypothetical protein